MKNRTVKFKGDITTRERQMIQAIIWAQGQALMSSYGERAASLTASELEAIVALQMEFGQKNFPDLTFWIE